MNTPSKIITISATLCWMWVCAVVAGEPRDGSSEPRAIVVPVDYAHYHEWERDYLKKHFPAHFAFTGQPVSEVGEDHAFIGHKKRASSSTSIHSRCAARRSKSTSTSANRLKRIMRVHIRNINRPNQTVERMAAGLVFHALSSEFLFMQATGPLKPPSLTSFSLGVVVHSSASHVFSRSRVRRIAFVLLKRC